MQTVMDETFLKKEKVKRRKSGRIKMRTRTRSGR